MENTETRIERDAERRNEAQQHTGNHDRPAQGGADRHGGTRAGAENVERIEKATDVNRVTPLEERLEEDLSVNGPVAPERDERGRL